MTEPFKIYKEMFAVYIQDENIQTIITTFVLILYLLCYLSVVLILKKCF